MWSEHSKHIYGLTVVSLITATKAEGCPHAFPKVKQKSVDRVCPLNESPLANPVPRPSSVARKRVWWLLSDFLVVPTMQWCGFWTSQLVPCHPTVHIKQWKSLHIMQTCNKCSKINTADYVCTTKKSLNFQETLFLVWGWGWLATRHDFKNNKSAFRLAYHVNGYDVNSNYWQVGK